MIEIDDDISLDEDEIVLSFSRACLPGGQTLLIEGLVQGGASLRFDARTSPSLPQDVRDRLETIAGFKLTIRRCHRVDNQHGIRNQDANRHDAYRPPTTTMIRSSAVGQKVSGCQYFSERRHSGSWRLETKSKWAGVKRLRSGKIGLLTTERSSPAGLNQLKST